ncbi:MAG: alpha/beta hydrolase [Culturomica sp.]|jgi:predicted esterase|nr:alpha/beta hydrolase [Culturomica sp.]
MNFKHSFLTILCFAIVWASCEESGENPVDTDVLLNKIEANALAATRWQEELEQIQTRYGTMWDRQLFEYNNRQMPTYTAVYGVKPADGRSLYISMHGGGNTTAAGNDEQWNNQKELYSPKEGVYIAPRAAVDDWNMWFRPVVDTLFEMIIQTAIVKMEVNPNKVYIMGYSAGGDGAYRMAPRMADHWAAAAMMAGHPGNSSPLNLRNIGFTLWMGQNDSAYHRNTLAAAYGQRLDSLQNADPDGYRHTTHIVPGVGHWMNSADTAAVEWMAQFRRNPYPGRIVWRQEESNPRRHFYYLSVPAGEAKAGMEVRVDKIGNILNILKNDYTTLYIHLNDKMMDLDKPVILLYGDEEIFNGMVQRKAQHIDESVKERADPDYIFSAVLEIRNGRVRVL